MGTGERERTWGGCGWGRPLLIGILQATLLESRKERERCRHLPSQRKEHVSWTHSCHLCLVTGRNPLLVAHTPGAEGCWSCPHSQGQLGGMGRETPPSLHRADDEEGGCKAGAMSWCPSLLLRQGRQDSLNSVPVTGGRGPGTKRNFKGGTPTKNSVVIAAEWHLTCGK